jgi:FMN phosphatase YigB (HAD superfamily)
MLRFGKQVLRRPRVLLGFGGGLGLWASASNKTQNSRPNIVFDLDGTLATTLKIRKDSDREKLLQARESDFVMKDEAANADDVHQQQQQQQRHVWIRPHAVWVLRLLATFCNIHLFTEAKQEYRPDHRPQDANHDAIKTICGRSSKWIVCPHNANVLRSNAVTWLIVDQNSASKRVWIASNQFSQVFASRLADAVLSVQALLKNAGRKRPVNDGVRMVWKRLPWLVDQMTLVLVLDPQHLASPIAHLIVIPRMIERSGPSIVAFDSNKKYRE